MRVLGDKEAARKAMIANGFPVVPGSEGTLESVREAVVTARGIGYPLMIKAVKAGRQGNSHCGRRGGS
jgi:acetyl-CoA carboxylase biotin carboxylase subunit